MAPLAPVEVFYSVKDVPEVSLDMWILARPLTNVNGDTAPWQIEKRCRPRTSVRIAIYGTDRTPLLSGGNRPRRARLRLGEFRDENRVI
jgi:hypothetical protein